MSTIYVASTNQDKIVAVRAAFAHTSFAVCGKDIEDEPNYDTTRSLEMLTTLRRSVAKNTYVFLVTVNYSNFIDPDICDPGNGDRPEGRSFAAVYLPDCTFRTAHYRSPEPPPPQEMREEYERYIIQTMTTSIQMATGIPAFHPLDMNKAFAAVPNRVPVLNESPVEIPASVAKIWSDVRNTMINRFTKQINDQLRATIGDGGRKCSFVVGSDLCKVVPYVISKFESAGYKFTTEEGSDRYTCTWD